MVKLATGNSLRTSLVPINDIDLKPDINLKSDSDAESYSDAKPEAAD
ncbi:hypothetical protein TUM4637_33350 [Shewanella hafniensis]|nr:hypothetical protein TUM4637_33350 [Shewanella hafniensis]